MNETQLKKTNIQKKREYELNKRRNLIRKQIKANKEINQDERRRNIENMVEVIDLGSFFELATAIKRHFSGLNLHEIEN